MFKKESGIILKKKIKYYAKRTCRQLRNITIAIFLISTVIFIKYQPMYKVTVLGQEIGYIENKQALEESIKEVIIEENQYNIDDIEIKTEPTYELQLVAKDKEENAQELEQLIIEEAVITYKYYEIAALDEVIRTVDTLEEAEILVEEINKETYLDVAIIEKYTQNSEEIKSISVEDAKINIVADATNSINIQEATAKEEARIASLPDANGIKFSVVPTQGTITSRYGEVSYLRSGAHTGLDIAAPYGTPIKSMADGTVIFAEYNGAYGYVVIIDHGNGVESWYAHTSKMLVNVGDKVKAGDIIANVGSTGNSTGNHLHLEIRVDGEYMNPELFIFGN